MSEVEHLRDDLRNAVKALRELNSAIWLDHPGWALSSPLTAEATRIIVTYDSEWKDDQDIVRYAGDC